MEQVCTREALETGYRKVKQNSKKGSKRRRAIETFGKQLEKRLSKLSKSLKMGELTLFLSMECIYSLEGNQIYAEP
jgi:hypothetical protein